MTSHSLRGSDALIFALDEQARQIGSAVIATNENEYPDSGRMLLVMVVNAGDALRLVHRHEPRFLIVCAGRERLDELAILIHSLRSRRSALPLLAIAGENEESIERAVRIAGANYYFTLGAGPDDLLLRQTLGSLGHSPPASQRFVVPRIRGRPVAHIAHS